jgi:hypothetical protein
VIIPSRRRPFAAVTWLAAAAAAAIGVVAAVHYARLDLTLTHYDARGHLIVARRIIDNITPGWQQIGAVWLPLPHLLNMLPVQIDLFYRTGWSAVALSVASFAIAAGAIASIVRTLTGSAAAALAATAVFALNPNVVYLQSTPMTEPLLIALSAVALASAIRAISGTSRPLRSSGRDGITAAARPVESRTQVGLWFALACLTRYEAWPVTAVALVLMFWSSWRQGNSASEAARAIGEIALYPGLAIVGFAIFSRVVVGAWFVSGDFFVPENKAVGNVTAVLREIGWATVTLSGNALVWMGTAGMGAAAIVAVADRRRAHALLVLSLLATAAVPLAAFYRGHPFRIRYMVPLIAAEAVGCGLAAGWTGRARIAAAAVVIAAAAATLHPLDGSAPMVAEAQWDRPNLPARAEVTRCIGRLAPGAKIMASMGSLGHYMQEAAADGLQLRDFLHEGNGDIWLAAIERPRPFADWLLIEEKAEGGDMLARIAREHPRFLDGYSRVCEGAGLALYRRN